MSEVACLVIARAGATVLKKISSSITIVGDEPASWQIVLDNSERDYITTAAIANPRTFSSTLSLEVEGGGNSWNSVDLILEDYSYDTNTVTISGRCRLAQLDREDQPIGDYENTTVAVVLAAVATLYGMTVTGAPTRALKLYHAIGNPLEIFRDLLQPTHTFRMGAGSQIVIQSITSNPTGPSYEDDDHLEIVRFKRTSDIYNKATVERVVQTSGRITLVNDERSGGDELAGTKTVTFSEPSRVFNLDRLFARRGKIQSIVFLDQSNNPINATPFNQVVYVGLTPVYAMQFQYDLITANAVNWGDWTPRWEIEISGYPLSISPVPIEGYSQTATAGAGDRPYPEPFTSLALETEAAALAAAQALVAIGTRQGNMLDFSTRLAPTMIPSPNQSCAVTDYLSGLSGSFIVEAVTISEEESGDTGTITVEASRSEGS